LENILQKQQQEKGENMRRQEGARQRAVGHAAEVVSNLATKYSNLANLSQGTKPQQILSGVMDLTSVPVGFAAEGLLKVLQAVEAGSETGVFLGAGATFTSGKYFLSKGFGRDNPARKKREEELINLKASLNADINELTRIFKVINSRETEAQIKSEDVAKLKDVHPSSKLLKVMTKFEEGMKRAQELADGKNQGLVQERLYGDLAQAIDDEIKRLEKFNRTDTVDMKPIKKLITELHNRFKDIMLSFRESKLQGLKHVALGFGELLLGIGAVVATFAAALVLIPLVVVPCFGINLATRITSFLAGVCVLVANRLYHAFAMLNSALFLKRDQQDDFSKSIDGRVKELDDLQIRLFDLAMKTPSKGEPENLSSDPYTSKGEVEQHSAGGSEQQVSSGGEGSEKHLGGGASQSVTNELTHAVQSVSAAASHGQQQSILDAGANPNL
jgi:hypothetical protein